MEKARCGCRISSQEPGDDVYAWTWMCTTQHANLTRRIPSKPKLKLETKAHCDLSLYHRMQTKNSLSDMSVIRMQTNLKLARFLDICPNKKRHCVWFVDVVHIKCMHEKCIKFWPFSVSQSFVPLFPSLPTSLPSHFTPPGNTSIDMSQDAK